MRRQLALFVRSIRDAVLLTLYVFYLLAIYACHRHLVLLLAFGSAAIVCGWLIVSLSRRPRLLAQLIEVTFCAGVAIATVASGLSRTYGKYGALAIVGGAAMGLLMAVGLTLDLVEESDWWNSAEARRFRRVVGRACKKVVSGLAFLWTEPE